MNSCLSMSIQKKTYSSERQLRPKLIQTFILKISWLLSSWNKWVLCVSSASEFPFTFSSNGSKDFPFRLFFRVTNEKKSKAARYRIQELEQCKRVFFAKTVLSALCRSSHWETMVCSTAVQVSCVRSIRTDFLKLLDSTSYSRAAWTHDKRYPDDYYWTLSRFGTIAVSPPTPKRLVKITGHKLKNTHTQKSPSDAEPSCS